MQEGGAAEAYPGVGDARLGVLEGREQPHGQVVRHVQQLVVVVLDCHVTKGLPGVRYYSVGGEEAPQDPRDRGTERHGGASVGRARSLDAEDTTAAALRGSGRPGPGRTGPGFPDVLSSPSDNAHF